MSGLSRLLSGFHDCFPLNVQTHEVPENVYIAMCLIFNTVCTDKEWPLLD